MCPTNEQSSAFIRDHELDELFSLDCLPSSWRPSRKHATPASGREGAVVLECLHWCRRNSILATRTQSGKVVLADDHWMRLGRAGWPDITGVLPGGKFLGIECKARHGGRQSDEQKEIQQRIESAGGVYVLARGEADLVRALSPHGGEQRRRQRETAARRCRERLGQASVPGGQGR
jgi:hypothetical protein